MALWTQTELETLLNDDLPQGKFDLATMQALADEYAIDKAPNSSAVTQKNISLRYAVSYIIAQSNPSMIPNLADASIQSLKKEGGFVVNV